MLPSCLLFGAAWNACVSLEPCRLSWTELPALTGTGVSCLRRRGGRQDGLKLKMLRSAPRAENAVSRLGVVQAHVQPLLSLLTGRMRDLPLWKMIFCTSTHQKKQKQLKVREWLFSGVSAHGATLRASPPPAAQQLKITDDLKQTRLSFPA